VIFAAAALLSFLVPAFLLLSPQAEGSELLARYGPTLLAAIPLWLCSGIIALSMLFVFRNSGLASILYFLFYTVGFFGMGLLAALASYYDGIVARVIGVICIAHPYNALWACIYQGSAFGKSLSWELLFGGSSWDRLWVSWLIALAWSVAAAVAALLSLRYRELR
jgi:ABC-type branched-subunit amino acid transport system permease subunit